MLSGAETDRQRREARDVEAAVRDVYGFCPPTRTYYASEEARRAAAEWWGGFLGRLGAGPERFRGADVLDVGCGSCEKTALYHDWGARVIGIDSTPEVLALAREVVGTRAVHLVQGSILDFQSDEWFDIVIADGSLHHTVDTYGALAASVRHLRPGGRVIFSIVNVWGSFWWFPFARTVTRALGGSDFHRRAAWGRRLFGWTRRSQEATSRDGAAFRGVDSWSYDWFANPRWNLHSPREVREWLRPLGLVLEAGIPSLVAKGPPSTPAARALRRLAGPGDGMLGAYWLLNREPNMMYVSAVSRPDDPRP